jgi:hypothetical protein
MCVPKVELHFGLEIDCDLAAIRAAWAARVLYHGAASGVNRHSGWSAANPLNLTGIQQQVLSMSH